ncbi:hypothetical protein [Pedobacter caeni]|uniref:Uncharacterized protein n=1 Tax=Pedobacter caeni TaxID=288992 RepID=A0A1M5B6V8_9SPHI|nr:hypothetical protein [Pedobacter caeni]SHF38254.1 hypothetical protein SAMN04488522_1021053 [Pedobacter caeni]
MNRNSGIQRKAAFLLIVFLLNTVVGFACSVGMNMGVAEAHHHDQKVENHHHDHGDGEKEDHSSSINEHHSNHDHSSKHHHSSETEKTADDCCTDQVQKIERADKLSPPVLEFNHYQPFFTLIYPNFFHLEASVSSLEILRPKHLARDYHPPIPDIRIAVQSFQI